jgi:hypothetical protein
MANQYLKSEIDHKKIEIISFISRLEKVELLLQIEELIQTSVPDWWTLVSDIEKEKIKEGLRDIEEGKVVSHDVVMKRAQEKIQSFSK